MTPKQQQEFTRMMEHASRLESSLLEQQSEFKELGVKRKPTLPGFAGHRERCRGPASEHVKHAQAAEHDRRKGHEQHDGRYPWQRAQNAHPGTADALPQQQGAHRVLRVSAYMNLVARNWRHDAHAIHKCILFCVCQLNVNLVYSAHG